MIFYHITLNEKARKSKIIPSIPECTTSNENINISRISIASSIKECIRGIGKTESYYFEKPIRVYSFDISINDTNLLNWIILYEKELVPDSPLTHECWYTKPIIPCDYHEYLVLDIVTSKHLILSHDKKNEVIHYIEKNGFIIPSAIKEKSVVEIVECYRNRMNIDELKCLFKRLKEDDEQTNKEIYYRIFKEMPQNEYYNDYVESVYIDDCKLRLVF